MTNLFEYQDYKAYLIDLTKNTSGPRKLSRQDLARAMKCQASFISQVLGGAAHFSLEQGDRVNLFLEHGEEEADYFLLLIGQCRAGTDSLREHFHRKLVAIRERRLEIKPKMRAAELTPLDQARYYASWIPAAVHVALAVPGLGSSLAIGAALGVAPAQIAPVLELLETMGLAEEKNGVYKQTKKRLHLSKESPFIAQHHGNWRMQCMRSLDGGGRESDLHFSSVASLSQSVFLKVRESVVRLIEQNNTQIAGADDEMVCAICFDVFRLT